ncbi:hypothetical protein [Oceanicella actignis]|nr:hypothetical protein [Oceanicella actignis]
MFVRFDDEGAAARVKAWAGAGLRRAGLTARRARAAADRLADAAREAIGAIRGREAGADAEVMLVLRDDDGELAFEMVADGDRPVATLQDGAGPWEAIERRVAGDGVTCLRMRPAD